MQKGLGFTKTLKEDTFNNQAKMRKPRSRKKSYYPKADGKWHTQQIDSMHLAQKPGLFVTIVYGFLGPENMSLDRNEV